MNIYAPATANYPRNNTDIFFDLPGEKKFTGCLDRTASLITDMQLRDADTWRLFVEQFRIHADSLDAGWRGEYWGKLMRSACFVYAYSRDEALYSTLKATVLDMLSAQDELGRISTFSQDKEFDGWDLWGRKYVLLGMQYFIEISGDDALNQKLIHSMCRQVRYLTARIGDPKEGKRLITKLTRHWRGLNSSSILEPIVRLYNLTGEQEFLDFATYIVEQGFTDVSNIWHLAYENELRIYQYPVTKAYEMTSCFIGLLEYYRITKNPIHLQAIINYARIILEDEFTVIGSAGCTHELFDHSRVRQTTPRGDDPRSQETCVTVTLMQFFAQLHLITGDSRYMDAFETSLYNGYLGAVNTDGAIDLSAQAHWPNFKIIPLPFDSYSPLTPGNRGSGIGGFRDLKNGRFYGCCVAMGPLGIGLAMRSSVLTAEEGLAISLFERGTVTQPLADGKAVTLFIDTDYPADGQVIVRVEKSCEEPFSLMLRNPGWSENTQVWVNGEVCPAQPGYIALNRVWKPGDTVKVCFDMRSKAIRPIPYGRQLLMNKVIWGANYMVSTVDYEHPDVKNHIAIRRGPLMLARENRLGLRVQQPICVKTDENDYVDVRGCEKTTAPYPCLFAGQVPAADGSFFTVTDYASAGKTWSEESETAVWMKTK